jgi:hypothetical protein
VNRDWLVLNCLTNELECKRCGATERVVYGVSITDFVKASEAFGKVHGFCKEKK